MEEQLQPNIKSAEQSLTIRTFCKLEDISLPTYYKLRKAGYGPEEMRVPETAIVRISPEAHREWRERIKNLSNSPQVQKERRALSRHGKRAGAAAAKSPKHISRPEVRAKVIAAQRTKKAAAR